MNLRDLTYLVAVADLNSFKQAADQCCISQPTLSTQIKKMETTLGVKLFERNNKQVMVTDPGKQILGCARRILNEVDTMKNIADSTRDPFAGTLKLGAFPTIASYIFPSIVPRLTSAFPDLKLILIEEKTDTLIQQLIDGKIDCAILALPVKETFLDSIALFEDNFTLAVSNRHELANRRSMSMDELSGRQLLLLEEGHCLRDQALDICNTVGSHADQDFRATSLETLRQMVRANTGITLIPQIACGEENDIHYISLEEPIPKRSIGLVSRKTSSRKVLIDKLSQHMSPDQPT